MNTLVVRDGRVLGSSTDGPAVVGLVEAERARVLVLGAGGEAQAVATSLGDAGAESITVAARDAERRMRSPFGLTLFPESEISAESDWPPAGREVTLIVNATPVRDEALVEPLARAAGGRPRVQAGRIGHRPRGRRAESRVRTSRRRSRGPARPGGSLVRALDGHRGAVPVMRAALALNGPLRQSHSRTLGSPPRSLSHRLCGVALTLTTAGESHGPALVGIVAGLPAGLGLDRAAIEADLHRRQQGYGRSPRQKIETDTVEVSPVSGTAHPRNAARIPRPQS